MKHYIFEKSPSGMDKYFKSIPKIRSVIRSYLDCECKEFKDGMREEYNEANNIYKNFLVFKSFLRNEFHEYIDSRMHHHVPKVHINVDELFTHWLLLVYHPMHFYLDEIDIKAIGNAIMEAREKAGMGRIEVANILKINCRTLEAYEKGDRVMPLDIYLKINQFLRICL